VRSKPGFAKVFESNNNKEAALHYFNNLKEGQLNRKRKFNTTKEQLQLYKLAIVETKAFMDYLKKIPSTNRNMIHASS
jgi:hypothetical protein